MAVVIQVDIQQARSDVQALNQDILNIASAANTVKSAFGGSDFMAGFMDSLMGANAGVQKLQENVTSLNQALGVTNQGLKQYTDTTRDTVQSAQQASQAILGKVDSLQKEASATKSTVDAMEQLNAAEARAALTWTNQEKVLRATTTALQLKRQVTKELNDMMEQNLITERDAARYQEIMASTYRNTGTAAEVLLSSLKQQNSEFLATQGQLLRMTDGWKTLTDTQRAALQTQQQINNDIRLVSGYYNDAGNVMTVFNEKMQAINRLHEQGHTTATQHAQAVDNLTREFNLEVSAAQKAAEAMAKKSYADSAAGQQEKKVQDAINSTTNIITRGLDPVAQYTKRINDLNTALAGASTYGGGRIGITQQQYQQGLRGAREELEKNIASSVRARSEMGALNNQFNLGAQATAGFRAGLQGAGVGFGIFTSNTIAVATAVYGMSKAIRESLVVGADFQETFTRGIAMMDGFDLKTRQLTIPIQGLQSQVMGLSETTRFSSTEISKALVALGQAGYNTAEAMKALPTVLNLATVGEQTTEEATNRLINVITAFGMKAADAASASDKLVEASLVSTTTIGELMTGLGQVGAVAHNSGVEFETVLGALAAMRQQGIQASKAGTDLRYAIQRLSEPTAKASQTMNQLGIDMKKFFDQTGAFDLTATLKELDRVLGSINEKSRNAALYTIFGSRASVGFTALLNTANDAEHGIEAMTAKIRDSQGATQALADIVNNNAKTAFAQLGHTIENVAINAFQSNQEELTAKIREFSDYIKANGPQIADTIAGVSKAVLSLTEFLLEHGKTIAGVFIVYEGWRTLSTTVAAASSVIAAGMAAAQAATMRAAAATVDDTLAVNERAVTGATRLLPELAAEVAAFDAQAVAAGRAGAATVASGTAATAATGAWAALRAAGSGLVALLGGWPTIIAAAVLAVGYLAYKWVDSMKLIEVSTDKAHEKTNALVAGMANLSSLDYNGLIQFRSQLDTQSDALKKNAEDLQHNIDLLKERETITVQNAAVAAKVGYAPGLIGLTAEEKQKLDDFNAGLKQTNEDLAILADRRAALDLEVIFKIPNLQPFLGDLDKLMDKNLRLSYTNQQMDDSILLFFNNMRLKGVITAKEYDDFAKSIDLARDKALRAAQERAIWEGTAPPNAKPVGATPGANAGASEAAARARELSSELEKVVNAYNKATGAAGEWNTQLKEDAQLQAALAKGDLRKELEKLGITSQEAKAALDWKVTDDVFDSIKAKLVEMNPAFKDVSDGTKDLTKQSSDLGDAYALVDQMMAAMIAKQPSLEKAIRSTGEMMKGQLKDANDGTLAAIKEFNSVLSNTSKNWTNAFQVDGIENLTERVQAAGVQVGQTAQGTLVAAQAFALLGNNSKNVAQKINEVTQSSNIYAQVQNLLNQLAANPAIPELAGHYDEVAAALRRVAEATPEGKLEKQNENLKNQMAIIASGSNNLDYYNTLWQATNGHLETASEELKKAAAEQTLLNEQFSRMQEVQNTFKSFATSLGEAFGKFFTNTKHGWSDLVSDIKSSFKKLLQDLITQAITNQILFYFGFNNSGWGGGGGSLGGLVGAAAGLLGLGGGGGGSSGATGLIGSLIGGAAANNASYTGVGAPSGGTFGGIGGLQNLYSAGKYGYQAVTGQLTNPLTAASGRVMPGSSYFGSYVYGPMENGGTMGYYSPTALGYGAAAATGLYMGYNRYQDRYNTGTGLAAGATYAVGGTALALGVGSMMAGGSFAAGVGAMAGGATAMGASAGVAAAVPVIGWIALAIMAIDMLSGGKLFGTSANKFQGGATNTSVSDSGVDLTGHYTFKGQKPLFGGSYYRDKPMDITPEMQAQADKVYNQIHQVSVATARQLGVDAVTNITGEFEAQFDKNGDVTKTISTVLGKTYEEPLEDFVKRMQAESIVSLIQKSITGNTTPYDDGSSSSGGGGGPGGGTDRQNQMQKSAAQAAAISDEVSKLVDQFRSDASTLLDAAQFLLAAQLDIQHGVGLLRESSAVGVLTDTMNIVQALAASGETLAQTYARLMGETQLLDQVFDSFGSTMTRKGTDFVQFADDFVQALGGLDKATAAWDSFQQAVFGSVGYITQATSSGKIGGELEALGLSATTTVEQFAQAFRSVADSLDATELAQWVQAGADLGTINQAFLTLQGMADGVDLSSVISQQQQLVAQVNQWITTAAQLGASEEQLAQMRQLGKEAIARQLSDFMDGINQQIDKFEGGDWLYQLDQINKQMRQNIDTARAMGASEADLARIQQLAAYQTAEVIAQLQQSITSLVNQLHGVTDANGQASSNAGSIANQGQNAIDQAQRDLYNAAQSAIQQITEFLDSLQTGPLSTQDWQGQLNSSRTQFDELVARAQGGDVDAMQQLTQYAQTYLQHAQDAYGNNTTYGGIYDYVTGILAQLQNQFEHIQEPPDAGGGGSDSSGSSATLVTLTDSDKYQISLQIAQQLGALGVALDASVWDLMDSFGVTIQELAGNLNVDLNKIDETFFTNLNILANALGTSTIDVLNHLDAQPAAIGAFFDVTAANINAGNLDNIATMAEALGISAFDAITYMGGDLATAIKNNGIDITSLDPTTMTALGAISNTLGVSIVDLLTHLGVGIDAFAQPLADTIRDDLSKIPDLADSTVKGLDPLLTALGVAITTGDLNTALGNIDDYIATLPEDQAEALKTLFDSLGITLDQGPKLDAQMELQNTIATNTGNTATALNTLHDDIAGTGSNSLVSKLGSISSNTGYLSQILTELQHQNGTNSNTNTTTMSGGYVPPGGQSSGASGGITDSQMAAGLMSLPTQMFDMATAGQQAFEASVGDGSTVARGAAASQQTVEQVAAMVGQLENLHQAVVSKLGQLNQTQGQTRDATQKVVRQGKMATISRSVK